MGASFAAVGWRVRVFKSLPVSYKGFWCIILNDAFHVGVTQRNPKVIFHIILDAYPHFSFMNNGLSIVQNQLMQCDSS